jgi:hypothetical protein
VTFAPLNWESPGDDVDATVEIGGATGTESRVPDRPPAPQKRSIAEIRGEPCALVATGGIPTGA